MQECYGQLQAEGYLTARGRVGHPGRGARRRRGRQRRRRPRRRADRAARRGVDFASGVPDLAAFPREDWAWAVREACRTAPPAFDYGDPRGDPRLREVLAGYLRAGCAAAATDPDRTCVCSGFAQGVTLVLRTLARAGYDRIALENPGRDRRDRAARRRRGSRPCPVPVDEHGVDVDALAASGAQVVVVTPAHQSPTGVVLSRRAAARADRVGAATGRLVVEDDYDAEFRYDRDPVGVAAGPGARAGVHGRHGEQVARADDPGRLGARPARARRRAGRGEAPRRPRHPRRSTSSRSPA